jgi:predicted dehydrogenase
MDKITRRDFAKVTAAAGISTALGKMRVLGANDRVNLGVIGCGGRGSDELKRFLKQPDINAVAVCDVYEPFMARAVETAGGKVATHKDFRQLLDRKDIDAVLIATPDHWHALQTVMACRAGKDVYVEKPLTLTIQEGRVMVNEARKNKRVVQTGSQQRSGEHYARAVKLIREGGIGEVHKISAGSARNAMPGFVARELKKGLTSELDWDMWLGPAPFAAFDPLRCIYHFRWFWDYSGGQMTNFGAHDLDIVRWALDAKAPAAVAGFGGRYAIKDGGQTPDVQQVIYNFPGCVVTWSISELNKGREAPPLEFHGTKGTLQLSRAGFKVVPEVWRGRDSRNEKPEMAPIEDPGSNQEDSHIRNFLDCVKSRNKPNADVEDGHLTATMCHIGNISTRLGRSLRWDPEKEMFIDDKEANTWLSRPYRKPWKL